MKISIILTSFNSAKFLKYSINSVLSQSYKNFELIIVDDASKDKSQTIIKNFKKKDNRIKYFFFKNNTGTAAIPRNKGVKIAKGDFICFLDADDIWKKNKLEEQKKLINKNTLISFTSSSYIKEDGKKYSNFFQDYVRKILQNFFIKKGVKGLFAYNPIILSSVLIKKKEFNKYYFDTSESLVGVEDLDLWLKILYNSSNKNVSFCDQKLVKIRRTPNSLNINYSQAALRAAYCVMKFFIEKKLLKDIQIFLIGISLRILKNLIKVSKLKLKKISIKFLTATVFIYLTFFYSPFFWYIGNSLVYYDAPKLTNTLIILSGNGNADYINTSYQRRYLDTKILLERNKFKNIFIMGRNQEIEESEIIRSLLTYDGIKKENIFLLNKTFANTKENITELKNILVGQNIKEVNFLTSPYHTKRSKMLWLTHKDKIDVYVTENINNPKKLVRWRQDFKNIKVIIYEYMAIIYNKLRGWI